MGHQMSQKMKKAVKFQVVRNKLFWHVYLAIQLGDQKNQRLELNLSSLGFYAASKTSHHNLKFIKLLGRREVVLAVLTSGNLCKMYMWINI